MKKPSLSVEREADHDGQEALFAVETRSSRGVRRIRHARNVIFAIGYYDAPNLLNVPGEDLPHVHHYYSEPHPYYRQRVVIVGGGNSAAEWALEMFRSGVHVTLVHRHAELKKTIKYWVRPDIENRIKEGSIAARFNTCVTEIRPTSVIVSPATIGGQQARSSGSATGEEIPADAVFLLVGYHADWELMERAGVVLQDKRVPTYDAETFETNVPGSSSPAELSAGETPATSSSRTAGFTARRSSRPLPDVRLGTMHRGGWRATRTSVCDVERDRRGSGRS